MRVTRIDTFAVAVPHERPIRLSSRRRVEALPHVLVRVHTDVGTEGIGFAFRLTMQDVGPLLRTTETAAHAIMGIDPTRPETARESLQQRMTLDGSDKLASMAASALDIALWDITGKAAGLPIYKLLGGARDRVPAYSSGDLWREAGPDELRSAVARHVDAGFQAVKMRIGGAQTIEDEQARVAAVRESAGNGVIVLADVNQGWERQQAVEMGRMLADHGLGWIEDPVHHTDVDGLAQVAASLDTPVCAGEHCFSKEAALRLLGSRAVDILSVDVLRVGGITEWRKIAATAEAHGLPVTSHLSPEVSVHLAAGAPNATFVEWLPASAPLFRERLRLENGALVAPDAPGLGLEFDEVAIERFRIR